MTLIFLKRKNFKDLLKTRVIYRRIKTVWLLYRDLELLHLETGIENNGKRERSLTEQSTKSNQSISCACFKGVKGGSQGLLDIYLF